MAFRFALQRLLSVRQAREHVERIRLGRLSQQVAALRQQVVWAQHALRDARLARDQLLAAGIPAAVLHLDALFATAGEQRVHALQGHLRGLEALLRQQQEAHWRALREVRILESLRERRFSEFRYEEQRREQSRTDELFLSRLVGAEKRK